MCNIVLDEDLIKWGWPEDVWFHVDKVSSAHVYLRLEAVSKKKKNLPVITSSIKIMICEPFL